MPVIEGPATLVEWRELAPEVRHFVFEGPQPLDFTAGQFVSFTHTFGGKNLTRAYSIVSPPNGARFEVCLNRVPAGVFSQYLFTLEPGAQVHMKGPYGAFTFRSQAADSVLLAAGTGIAPVRSMLLHRLPRDAENQYTLIFGARYEHGILYRADFDRLAANCPNFRFWPTLTRPPENWNGRTGRVQAHLVEAIGARRDFYIYICGLKAMVDDVRALLKSWGFDRRQLVYEKYD
jgi:CDP-4-dehydro-6-deoxyglucose reductase